jgi:hypothetical protein
MLLALYLYHLWDFSTDSMLHYFYCVILQLSLLFGLLVSVIVLKRSGAFVSARQSWPSFRLLPRADCQNPISGFTCSQIGTFSNMLSWATLPDGYYYPNLTARGLSGAFGAITHQIFLQYSPDVANCRYYGADGSGEMYLMPVGVLVSNIVLGLAVLSLILINAFSFLAYPLRHSKATELFTTTAMNLHDDTHLMVNSGTWVTDYVKKFSRTMPME